MNKQAILLCCVFLLMMPVVLADFESITASGEAGIDGFITDDDTLTLEAVVAVLGDDTITADQVHVGEVPFQQCALTFAPRNEYTCVYNTSLANILHGVVELTFTLYDDNGFVVDQQQKEIVTDTLAPNVYVFEPVEDVVQQNVDIRYRVADTACSSCGQRCSGIAYINIVEEQNTSRSIASFAVENEACIIEETKTVMIDHSSGSYSLCARAVDKLGHVSELSYCTSVQVDSDAPQLEHVNLTVGGALLEFVNQNVVHAQLNALIEDDNPVSIPSVIADISSLNPDLTTLPAEQCVPSFRQTGEGFNYFCMWEVPISTRSATTADIQFTAEDDLGNIMQETASVSFGFDNTTGEVSDMFTQLFVDDTFMVVPENNEFVVVLNKEGAGFADRHVFLDLTRIGDHEVRGTRADECVSAGNTWECYWYNISSSLRHNEEAEVILINTKDDIGNSVTGLSRLQVTMDARAPELLHITHSCESELLGITTACSADDTLTINALVVETTGVQATANVTSVLPDLPLVDGQCEELRDFVFNCSWSPTENIPQGPFRNVTVPITFVDGVGNEVVETYSFKILEDVNETNPNVWRVATVRQIPKLVDRQTTTLIPNGVRIHEDVTLQPQPGFADAEIVLIEAGECSGDLDLLRNRKPELFNIDGEDKTNPWYKMQLANNDFDAENEIAISCNMTIYSKTQTTIFEVPEEEVVDFAIQFYNMPVGELSATIKDEIERIKNDPLVQNTMIGQMEKMLEMAELACSMGNGLAQGNNNMLQMAMLMGGGGLGGSGLSGGVGGLGSGLLPLMMMGGGFTSPAAQQATQTVHQHDDAVTKKIIGSDLSDEKVDLDRPETIEVTDKPSKQQGLMSFCAMLTCTGSTEGGGYGLWGDWYGKFIRSQGSLIGMDFAKMHFGCESTNPAGLSAELSRGSGQGNNLFTGRAAEPSLQSDSATQEKSVVRDRACGALFWPESPKDSLILSYATGCIPGIIHNLQKQRQIQCAYADCLQNGVANGMPVSVCKNEKAYQECKYVYGQMFQLIPFHSFFSGLVKQFHTMVRNPISAFLAYSTFNCRENDFSQENTACRFARSFQGMAGPMSSALQMFNGGGGLFNAQQQVDLCEAVLNDQPSQLSNTYTGQNQYGNQYNTQNYRQSPNNFYANQQYPTQTGGFR